MTYSRIPTVCNTCRYLGVKRDTDKKIKRVWCSRRSTGGVTRARKTKQCVYYKRHEDQTHLDTPSCLNIGPEPCQDPAAFQMEVCDGCYFRDGCKWWFDGYEEY